MVSVVCSHFSLLPWVVGQARALTEGAGQPAVPSPPATPRGALGEEHLSRRPRDDPGSPEGMLGSSWKPAVVWQEENHRMDVGQKRGHFFPTSLPP